MGETKPKRVNACGHPRRPYYARAKCAQCYNRDHRQTRPHRKKMIASKTLRVERDPIPTEFARQCECAVPIVRLEGKAMRVCIRCSRVIDSAWPTQRSGYRDSPVADCGGATPPQKLSLGKATS